VSRHRDCGLLHAAQFPTERASLVAGIITCCQVRLSRRAIVEEIRELRGIPNSGTGILTSGLTVIL